MTARDIFTDRKWSTRRNLNWIILACLMVVGFLIIVQNTFHVQLIVPNRINYEDYAIRESKAAAEMEKLRYEMLETTTMKATTTDAPPLAQRLKAILNCKDKSLMMERVQYGSYWLIRNIVTGSFSEFMGCAESITYTTNGDFTFFDNLALVVKRWLAPVSFAIFAPGYDINATMESIQYVRNCLPDSALIRSYVTFHIYFPNNHMPQCVPHSTEEALNWPYDCSVRLPPYVSVERTEMYKTLKNLTYPINVGRNIARKAANTYFIFACDIELSPTPGFVQQFLQMVAHNSSMVSNDRHPHVFPLPVFELDKNATIPETKTELVKLLNTKKAIPFHSRVCKICHLVPNQTEWVNASDANELSVFSIGKREQKFKTWEPFYISDNKEPMFDERVSWEGQSNKRIQGYAMCLLQYEYHVLHPAFLVHTPGIKKFDPKSPRLKFVPATNRLIKKTIEPEYRILYGHNSKCTT